MVGLTCPLPSQLGGLTKRLRSPSPGRSASDSAATNSRLPASNIALPCALYTWHRVQPDLVEPRVSGVI
jgi:hypothetical protein